MKRLAVALTVVALVAPMVLGLHPSTASAGAPSAKISIHQVAQLVTPTTGPIDLTVTYDCAPPSPTDTEGALLATVNQSGNVGTNGGQSATCDDKSHTTTVTVAGTFTAGPALATASVNGPGLFSSAIDEAEIRIK